MAVLPRGRAGHLALRRCLCPAAAATASAAQVQHPTGASSMAGDRQPEPDRRPPAPVHPRPLAAVRRAHVPPVRLLPRRRGLVGGHGQVLPEDQRPGVPGPAEDGRRQVHRVQLHRHAVVALRRVLAPGSPAVGHGAPQRAEAGVDGSRPGRGGSRHAARPAPRGHGRGGAQGAHAHGDAQRDLAHGVREEVHRRGGGGGGGAGDDDGGGVQVDDRGDLLPQRRVQHRRHGPLAGLAGPAGVHRQDEEAGRHVRPVPGARPGRARRAAAARGRRVRRQGHGGPAAAVRRRSQSQGSHPAGRRQSIHSGAYHGQHGHIIGVGGVGHVGGPEESGRPRQGHRGAGPRGRPRPPRRRGGHRQPPVPRRRREGEHAAAPRRAAPRAAGLPRGRVRCRLRHPGGHPRARQRLGHRPRPGGVGARGGGVPARAVHRERRGREGAGLRAAAVRVRPPDVPGIRPRVEDGTAHAGEPAARLRVEAPRRHGAGGAEHGGEVRDIRVALGPAQGHSRAQAPGSSLR